MIVIGSPIAPSNLGSTVTVRHFGFHQPIPSWCARHRQSRRCPLHTRLCHRLVSLNQRDPEQTRPAYRVIRHDDERPSNCRYITAGIQLRFVSWDHHKQSRRHGDSLVAKILSADQIQKFSTSNFGFWKWCW